jgi:hypothetical protein
MPAHDQSPRTASQRNFGRVISEDTCLVHVVMDRAGMRLSNRSGRPGARGRGNRLAVPVQTLPNFHPLDADRGIGLETQADFPFPDFDDCDPEHRLRHVGAD